MSKFAIDFDLEQDTLPPQCILLSYPDIDAHDQPLIAWVGLGGLLYIEIMDEPIFSNSFAGGRRYYISDRLFPTFGQLLNSISDLLEKSEVTVVFDLSGVREMKISPSDSDQVFISFDNNLQKGINMRKYPLSLEEYATVVISTVDRYISELLNLNPRLSELKNLKALMNSRQRVVQECRERGIVILQHDSD